MTPNRKQPLIAVVGPTASGKSDLGIALAHRFNGEIINCDSVQTYRGIYVATAKVPPEEQQGIPHHLIDIVEPTYNLTAVEWAERARAVIADIETRGKLALLIFDEDGNIDFSRSRMLSTADGLLGMDIPPGIWHSLVALGDAIIYEVKGHPAGGFVLERDKNFAAWAPEEGSPESSAYLSQMEEAARRLA